VALFHGLRDNRGYLLGRTAFLAAAGYRCVAVDHRAPGETGGKRTSFGFYESRDVAAVLETGFPLVALLQLVRVYGQAMARIADAESKPAQMQRAVACGFRIPRTLITNDPSQVRTFAEDVGSPLVYKPLSAGFLQEPDGLRVIYAVRLDSAEVDAWLEPEAIRLAPHQFQEWVDKTCDIRVTAVGDRLFPVAIHTTCPAALVDWRVDYSVLEYHRVELPPECVDSIRRYLATASPAFGTFDFVQDRAGQLWWLECNPNGEWAWLAGVIDDPIAEALAELLLSGHSS